MPGIARIGTAALAGCSDLADVPWLRADASAAPPDLWAQWDAIRCPTLVLRGKESDLLSAATAGEMAARGPRPAVVEFAGVGHAPMLLSEDQLAPVVRFLRDAPAP